MPSRRRMEDMPLRITMNDGMLISIIPMDSQDDSYYRRLSPDDRQDFLLNLVFIILTREDARVIIQRIRQMTKDKQEYVFYRIRKTSPNKPPTPLRSILRKSSHVSTSTPIAEKTSKVSTSAMMILTIGSLVFAFLCSIFY